MLNPVVLASGTGAAADPIVTASVSPRRRTALYAYFLWRGAALSGNPEGTLTGCGLTWIRSMFIGAGWKGSLFKAFIGQPGHGTTEQTPTPGALSLDLASATYDDYAYAIVEADGSYGEVDSNSFSDFWPNEGAGDDEESESFADPFTRPENGTLVFGVAHDKTETVAATFDLVTTGFTEVYSIPLGPNDSSLIKCAVAPTEKASFTWSGATGTAHAVGVHGLELGVSYFPKTATVM